MERARAVVVGVQSMNTLVNFNVKPSALTQSTALYSILLQPIFLLQDDEAVE